MARFSPAMRVRALARTLLDARAIRKSGGTSHGEVREALELADRCEAWWCAVAERDSLDFFLTWTKRRIDLKETWDDGPSDEDDFEFGDDEVTFDNAGRARCPDCNALLVRDGMGWSHSDDGLDDDEAPPLPLKPAAATQVKRVGRNDPCPCGSGIKYKHCHGK